MMRSIVAGLAIPAAALAQSLTPPPPPASDGLLTVAERTQFRMTSVSSEVIEQLDAVAVESKFARRISMGKTHEGREIPMLIIADPPVATADEAAAAAKAGRTVVLLFANIHAGECDGKEALGMIARDLATTTDHPLLKGLVVAIAPNYNADGNDNSGPTDRNRPGQVGPDGVCGRRENAMGLDLNRDFIKLEAPETKALVSFIHEWNPAVIADFHTTNGSNHQYLVTYAGPKAPATNPALIDFSRGQFLPDIDEQFEAKTGQFAFWYGNFEGEFGDAARGHTRWETFPAEARFGTTYIGLRGRQSVLVESYSYASYRDRVLGSYAFGKAILAATQKHADKLRTIQAATDTPAKVAIRSRMTAFPGTVTVKGFVEAQSSGRSVSTGERRDYTVELWDRFEPVLEVDVPPAYIIRMPSDRVITTLRGHGIKFETVQAAATIPAQVYTVTKATPASRPFQGHIPLIVDADRRDATVDVRSGDLRVPTDQPLGRLVVYLLEPMSEDGLTTWNFFDDACKPGVEFPIVRVK